MSNKENIVSIQQLAKRMADEKYDTGFIGNERHHYKQGIIDYATLQSKTTTERDRIVGLIEAKIDDISQKAINANDWAKISGLLAILELIKGV